MFLHHLNRNKLQKAAAWQEGGGGGLKTRWEGAELQTHSSHRTLPPLVFSCLTGQRDRGWTRPLAPLMSVGRHRQHTLTRVLSLIPITHEWAHAHTKTHMHTQYGGWIIILISLNLWEEPQPVIGSFILLHSGRLRTSRNILRFPCGARCVFACAGIFFCVTFCQIVLFLCAPTSVDLKIFAILCVTQCVCVCVLFSSSVCEACWQVARSRLYTH